MRSVLCYLTLIAYGTIATPLPQSGYYSGAHSLVPQQQQNQPQYISVPQIPQTQPPIYTRAQTQQSYSPPTQIVPQLLLPTNVDRQIQKVAGQIAGPTYVQQIQALQQQELANQSVAAAQRRAARRQMLALQAAQQGLLYGGGQPKQPVAAAQTQTEYIQYQPQTQYPVQAARPLPRPQPQAYAAQQKQPEEEEVYDDANSSYKFGFDVTDDQNTNYQNRQEQRDGNKISGSYSVVDSDGFIRTVTYTADPKEGFKAEVVRKPTDIVVKIPKPTPPPKEQYVQGSRNVLYQYE